MSSAKLSACYKVSPQVFVSVRYSKQDRPSVWDGECDFGQWTFKMVL